MSQPITIVIFISALFLSASCNRAITPLPEQPTEIIKEIVSPISTPISPVAHIPTPTAMPESGEATKIELPMPGEGLGTVGGILLTKNPAVEGAFAPVPRTFVFLGPVLYDADGQAVFTSLDQEHDPATSTGPTGIFVFQNVPAGQYGLFILHGVNIYPAMTENRESYIITVEAGKALNLGEIPVELPPL